MPCFVHFISTIRHQRSEYTSLQASKSSSLRLVGPICEAVSAATPDFRFTTTVCSKMSDVACHKHQLGKPSCIPEGLLDHCHISAALAQLESHICCLVGRQALLMINGTILVTSLHDSGIYICELNTSTEQLRTIKTLKTWVLQYKLHGQYGACKAQQEQRRQNMNPSIMMHSHKLYTLRAVQHAVCTYD